MRKSRKKSIKQEDITLLGEFINIIKGAVLGVIISLVFILIFAFVMRLSNLQDSIIKPVIQVVRVLSIAGGGAYAARFTLTKGWLKGAVSGIFYVILVSLIGIMAGGNFAFDKILLSDTIMALIVGAVGGAIGINIK